MTNLIDGNTVIDIQNAMDKINEIHPKQFSYVGNANVGARYGLFKTDIDDAIPDVVVDNYHRSWGHVSELTRPAGLVPLVIAGLKQLYAMILALQGMSRAIGRSAFVVNGQVVFYLTNNGQANGAALFESVDMDTDTFIAIATNANGMPHSFGEPSLSGDKKTITMSVNRSASASLLGVDLLSATVAANGSKVRMIVMGH